MSIGVIIVNYFTEDLLRPLVEQVVRFPLVRELVIFDNGSATPLIFDDSKVRVMATGCNLGFAAAVNRAFAALATDYVLLLNPDLRLDNACVTRLLEASRRNHCPIVGPRFFWDDERRFRLPPATGELRWLGLGADSPSSLEGHLRAHYWAIHHDHYWEQDTPFRQPFLSGACLLLASDWLRARGRVFDERYFMYYEDTDLCIEAQVEGWVPMCVPAAEATHYWDQSPEPAGGKARMMAAASRALRLKYGLPDRDSLSELPLLPRVPAPMYVNLGDLDTPPCFVLPPCQPGTRFEIAVGPGFVPFAQALLGPGGLKPAGTGSRMGVLARSARFWGGAIEEGVLTLPTPIWSRLRPGRYYARARQADGGIGLLWQWQRSL